MSAAPRPALPELGVRVGVFAALAAVAAWQWTRMVSEPPAGRVALAVGALAAGAGLLALISASEIPRPAKWALAAIAAVATTGAGLAAIGIPIRLLPPSGWDELGGDLGRGFAGLDGDAEFPYDGKNDWARLVLLAGLPLALGLSAAFAFWPAERIRRGPRTLGLCALIATCTIGGTAVAPGAPMLLGLLLLALVAAWLWLPRLDRRDAIAAGALVAIAGALAVGAATRLDAAEPWLDYESWDFAGDDAGTTFDWDHGYGPLDWPRQGETLFAVRSEKPHYWRASVLEDFDGVRWERPAQPAGQRLEAPTQIEGANPSPVVEMDELDPDWVEVSRFTFGPLRTDLVVAPGTPIEVSGYEGLLALADGTTVTSLDSIQNGDAYSVVSYAPDPTPREMRSASGTYPGVLSRYTLVGLPPAEGEIAGGTLTSVTVPLRGADAPDAGAVSERLRSSPYGEMYRSALRLTRNEPTVYDAVRSVRARLNDGPYRYSEVPPAAGAFPLADFFSEDRTGYCQQFSGAMALMLRMVGIPARVVSGFATGTRDEADDDRFLVTDFDAHSWVEVYFTGIGWVPFDPTPAASPAGLQIGEGELPADTTLGGLERGGDDTSRDRGEDAATGPRPSDRGGPWMALAIAVGVLALAVAVPAAVRWRRFRSLPESAAADAQLRELGSSLHQFGFALSTGETLLAIERELRMSWKPLTAGYVATLRAGRFERHRPDRPTLRDRRRVRRELAAPEGVLGRLRALIAIPPGAPRRTSESK